MSIQNPSELPSVETAQLSVVTGGTHRVGHSGPQLDAALAGIKSSLESLQTQRGDSSNNVAQLLPLVLLAKGGGGKCCR